MDLALIISVFAAIIGYIIYITIAAKKERINSEKELEELRKETKARREAHDKKS